MLLGDEDTLCLAVRGGFGVPVFLLLPLEPDAILLLELTQLTTFDL